MSLRMLWRFGLNPQGDRLVTIPDAGCLQALLEETLLRGRAGLEGTICTPNLLVKTAETVRQDTRKEESA